MNIEKSVKNLTSGKYNYLFDQACCEVFKVISENFGDFITDETIQEIDLSSEHNNGDYSFKISRKDNEKVAELLNEKTFEKLKTKSHLWVAVEEILSRWSDKTSDFCKNVNNVWLEMDYELCCHNLFRPCLFFDASNVNTSEDYAWIYSEPLTDLLGAKRVSQIKNQLDLCINILDECKSKLFQLGVMIGRNSDCIRVFSSEMNSKQLFQFLGKIGWEGDMENLSNWIQKFDRYTNSYIIDFDVHPDGISKKIGINFGPTNKGNSNIDEFLLYLHNQGLCTESKRQAVEKWLDEFPDYIEPIYNDVSHFKFVYAEDKNNWRVKAYLRQGSLPRKLFNAFARPRTLNMEITTRCPLKCPQCYCDLNKCMDLDLATGIRFIEEAGKLKIPMINLSGGETLVYPHLEALIKCCKSNGIVANVALSGYGFDEKILRKLIEAGISGIFISLNGSTEEINMKSRDGYDLAINALSILKNNSFKNYYINWVSHQSNIMDFPNLLNLAEEYEATGIVIMAFKPDSNYQLPSIPTGEQLTFLAEFIKQNKESKVNIEIESCYSQLRALFGQKFFINLNQGIEKGCMAGRDAISLSVNGKLTPCRHLDCEETYNSIIEYWDGSKILHKLRYIEKNTKEPCKSCKYEPYCLHCMAINYKIKGDIFKGNDCCELRNIK